MPNKKISQFPSLVNPTDDAVLPVVSGGANYSIALSGLTNFVNSSDTLITGGTYSANTITITNNTGGTISITGITPSVKYWVDNQNVVLAADDTVVISGNYVLSGTNLTLESANLNISVGNINFDKYAQIFIGGYLLLIDSNIVNNGLISVAGAIIFSGNSTIINNGFLI
jgi:hypothetical protein